MCTLTSKASEIARLFGFTFQLVAQSPHNVGKPRSGGGRRESNFRVKRREKRGEFPLKLPPNGLARVAGDRIRRAGVRRLPTVQYHGARRGRTRCRRTHRNRW